MEIIKLAIPEVVVLTPRRFADDRGHFAETYSFSRYDGLGVPAQFVQDNQSYSQHKGTLRGMHFQTPPFAQAKLVRVLKGAIYDVAVDIRRGSPTYGKWCGARLSAEEGNQIYVPHGFGHGFLTLEDHTEVAYKVDNYYSKDHEGGFIWNDADVAIDWPIDGLDVILSDKDKILPPFAKLGDAFTYQPQDEMV